MELNEKVIKSERKYDGKIINLRVDTVLLPNGKTSKRDIVEHPGGVCVVPITKQNELVMVRQYRSGPQQVLLELPAGKLEYGEDPYTCGFRELQEETGYTAGEFWEAISFYSTPGFTDEKLYLYIAKELSLGKTNLDEDEFIETETIPVKELKQMVLENKIQDAKTIIGILLAEQYLYD